MNNEFCTSVKMEAIARKLESIHISDFENAENDEEKALQQISKTIQDLSPQTPKECQTDRHRKNILFNATRGREWALNVSSSSNFHKLSYQELSSSFSDFRSKRQELAWLTHTRPDIACAVNKASQVTEENISEDDIKKINKVVKTAKKYSMRGLTQQKLDISTLRVVVYSDAAFATNSDHTSQLGYVVLLCDGNNNCNILHFSSSKSKRVARSVLGSEIYAFADGFDFAYSLRNDIQNVTGKNLPLHMLTDSKCLFDVLTSGSSLREKRLLIDIAVAKEAYQKEEINQVGHVFFRPKSGGRTHETQLQPSDEFYS